MSFINNFRSFQPGLDEGNPGVDDVASKVDLPFLVQARVGQWMAESELDLVAVLGAGPRWPRVDGGTMFVEVPDAHTTIDVSKS